jgi:hypothetical protein
MVFGLYALEEGYTFILAMYVIAGAFGIAAVIDKLWKE